MAQLAKTFKAEISRLARKEGRKLVEPAHKSATIARHEITTLKRRIEQLERAVGALTKAANRPAAASIRSDVARRFRVEGVKAHRNRLALSAEEFGKLIGVSGQAVYNWEQGKSRPKPKALSKLHELRSLGKREAASRLEALSSQQGGAAAW